MRKKFIVYNLRVLVRKPCLWLIVFFLSTIYYLPSTVYAAGGTFSLVPNNGTVNKGCSFSFDIIEDTGGSSSDGADAIVFYDATRLRVLSVNTGKIYSDYPAKIFDTPGKVSISGVASPDKPFIGSGTFATLNFQVLEAAPTGLTQVKFDFDPNDKTNTKDSNIGSIQNGAVVDILDSVTNANVTVGVGSCSGGSQGAPGFSGGSATNSGTPVISTPLPTTSPISKLPPAGDSSSLVVIAGVGGLLTLLGILTLVLL